MCGARTGLVWTEPATKGLGPDRCPTSDAWAEPHEGAGPWPHNCQEPVLCPANGWHWATPADTI